MELDCGESVGDCKQICKGKRFSSIFRERPLVLTGGLFVGLFWLCSALFVGMLCSAGLCSTPFFRGEDVAPDRWTVEGDGNLIWCAYSGNGWQVLVGYLVPVDLGDLIVGGCKQKKGVSGWH